MVATDVITNRNIWRGSCASAAIAGRWAGHRFDTRAANPENENANPYAPTSSSLMGGKGYPNKPKSHTLSRMAAATLDTAQKIDKDKTGGEVGEDFGSRTAGPEIDPTRGLQAPETKTPTSMVGVS